MRFALITLSLAVMQVGCIWPERVASRPGVFGRVVDRESGRPIADASVRLDAVDRDGKQSRATGCQTDQAGNFSFAQQRKLMLMMIIPRGDLIAMSGQLTVEHPEYTPRTIPFVGDTFDAGPIPLEPRGRAVGQ